MRQSFITKTIGKCLEKKHLKKNILKSYKLFINKDKEPSIVLITKYKDSTQFNLSEGRFEVIIKRIRPNGPKLLNEFKPNEFKQNIHSGNYQKITKH